MARFPCPCCGFATLTEPGAYEICPVCYWEDDPVQHHHPARVGGANAMSLDDARRSYRRIGAASPEHTTRVRPARADELPAGDRP